MKNWFCSDLAHFLMAQRHKIFGQVNRMCHPLSFQISSPCDHFNMRFYNFLLRCEAIKGYGKKHFGIWESRIRKTKNNFAFTKTWAPRYWILPGADVFRFCSFSFFMQILDSQWDMSEWQNCEFLLDTWSGHWWAQIKALRVPMSGQVAQLDPGSCRGGVTLILDRGPSPRGA